ncbi:recombinase family protein, partial [Lactococcus lactis]|uniref:helix-turn-helix domain-containing protein n=1 Tax=Lactococcus lactis TaxID=1358 RepID=UPI003D11BA81
SSFLLLSFSIILPYLIVDLKLCNRTGQLMFHLFAAFAEFERNLILERSAAGRKAARARGRLGGRPEKFSEQDIKLLKKLVESGTPIKSIADSWGVSRTTIYRYINKF